MSWVKMLPEGLRVGVGQGLGRDVAPAVGVALDVGVPDARDAEVLELVVLAHPGEGDAVVDLRDLVEQGGGVLGHEQDAVLVLEHDDGPAAGDALAGILRLVLHHLLGTHVVGQGHGSGSSLALAPLVGDRLVGPANVGLRDLCESVAGDGLHRREDAAHEIGAARPHVLVGGVPQGLEGDADPSSWGRSRRHSFLRESRASLDPEPWAS